MSDLIVKSMSLLTFDHLITGGSIIFSLLNGYIIGASKAKGQPLHISIPTISLHTIGHGIGGALLGPLYIALYIIANN